MDTDEHGFEKVKRKGKNASAKSAKSAVPKRREANAKRADLRKIRVSIDQAAALFQRSRKTVEIQLAAIGCPVVRGATFSLPDVCRAVANEYQQARTRVMEGNAEAVERENRRKAGALYDAGETDGFLSELMRHLFGELERGFASELPPVLVGQDAAHISALAQEAIRELKKGLAEKLAKWTAGQKPGEESKVA